MNTRSPSLKKKSIFTTLYFQSVNTNTIVHINKWGEKPHRFDVEAQESEHDHGSESRSFEGGCSVVLSEFKFRIAV